MSTWVIDTNILEHLLDTAPAGWNSDGHIRFFLQQLIKSNVTVGIDEKGRVIAEYGHRLTARIKQAQESIDGQILRWVVILSTKQKVAVNLGDGLGNCIAQNATGAERSDHVFVYVAGALGCGLASNNARHINDHTTALKRCARRYGAGAMEIYSSREAHAVIVPPALPHAPAAP